MKRKLIRLDLQQMKEKGEMEKLAPLRKKQTKKSKSR
jgi:hypothetical protein